MCYFQGPEELLGPFYSPRAGQAMRGKCILVVDDEPHVVHVIGRKLSDAGFEVLTAADGEEALAIATAELPDLIITDDQMPVLSGLELCERLKVSPRTGQIPAMLVTARGDDPPKERLDKTNIRLVLNKPFSPREILSNVNAVLGNITDAGEGS